MSRFRHEVHMRWSDMDAYRHVNNSAYLQYLEQARVAMFFEHDDGAFAQGTVIARHEIDYLRPVVYHPQPLDLELWVEQVRAAQFTVRYEVFDRGRLVARALTRCVTFDFTLDVPRRLSPPERAILVGFADGDLSDLGDSGGAYGDGPGVRASRSHVPGVGPHVPIPDPDDAAVPVARD